MGYSPWGHKESDTTERLTLSLFCFLPITQLPDSKMINSCPNLFRLYLTHPDSSTIITPEE